MWIKIGIFKCHHISIWFILSKSKAEMHILYIHTSLHITLFLIQRSTLILFQNVFHPSPFFHIMKKKLLFPNFKKVLTFIRTSRLFGVCILSTNNLNFEKKINSLSYLIWNSISEGSWLFHDSKGLTHTFCMWYSRTGMCMYTVVYSNRYTTYILDSV